MFDALLHYQFLQNALLASLFASFLAGLIGVLIVEKNMLILSGGIAHTSFGGVGLGYLLGFEPILGGLAFALVTALGIAHYQGQGSEKTDVIVGLFWSLGMALGVLFIHLSPGYPPDLNSYLFGNILTVSRTDLIFMLVITCLVWAAFILFFQDWKTYLFDREAAQIAGLPVTFFDILFNLLVALAIVALIRLAGIILVMALFSAPTAISQMVTSRLLPRIGLASLLGLIFCLLGLTFSYYLATPSGATIVIVACLTYGLLALFTSLHV